MCAARPRRPAAHASDIIPADACAWSLRVLKTEAVPVEPALTVIMPVYNAESSIGAALASVLVERSIPLECIVVDDASTDRTVGVVEAIAASDPRVILLCQEQNAGVSEARNRALDAARGEWLAFVDADDLVLPGAFTVLMDAAVKGDALVVIGQRVSTDGRRTWTLGHQRHPDLRTPGRKSLLRDHGLLQNVGSLGKLFHRSCTEGLRFAGRSLGDQPWVLRATLRAGDRVIVVDDTVYAWVRPTDEAYFSTITADRERSIDLAIAAVAAAGVAWRDVRAECAPRVAPAELDAFGVAHLDRIVRSDLARGLVNGVRRRDPRTDELLLALADLFETLPAHVVADCVEIADRLVRPVVAFWWRLPPKARPAFGTLLRTVEAASTGDHVRPAGAARHGILRNPGTHWMPSGGIRGSVGAMLAWPHAAGSLVLERTLRTLSR
jgi:hypothetical protein